MEKIFALYDSDVFYATRFMEYFKGKKEVDFIITVFTLLDKLEEFLQEHLVEILLLGEQVTMKEETLKNIKCIYCLTENPNKKIDTAWLQVYKYQSAKAVMAEILKDYAGKENLSQVKYNSDQTKIISIFAPVPGIEKLIFSWSISTFLSEQKRVLFVPIEPFPIRLPTNLDRTNQSLSEFIYYLKENSNITNKMIMLPQTSGNLSVLSGIVHGADLLSLNKEDIQNWMEEIRIHTDYQTVIFYLGCYTEAMIELMNLSDSILVTLLEGSYEAFVSQEWERQMGQSGVNTKQDKFEFVELQGEKAHGHMPATMIELTSSTSWLCAQQYLND